MREFVHIVGAGRGGTSLLAGVMDAHPACEIVFERLSVSHLMTDVGAPGTLEARTHSRVQRFLDACREEAGRSEALWGHKTTSEHIWALAEWPLDDPAGFDPIDYFISRLSEVPTVFVTRDGRTCVASKMRRTGMALELALARWKFSVELLRRFHASGAPLHVVKMEDLIANPSETAQAICQFLSIPYSEAMLTGTSSEKMLPEYRRAGFDRGTVQVPVTRPWWVSLISDELEYCEYL